MDTERQEQPCTQEEVDGTPDEKRLCIRYGESPPILVASLTSNHLWKMLTEEYNDPELKQEIEHILRERCDPRMNDETRDAD